MIQRVNSASVAVDGETVGEIGRGFLVLLGISKQDEQKDLDYLYEKVVNLRIFEDEEDKMNLSLMDVNGEMLVVSQFTLCGDTRKGRRPNFTEAADPSAAEPLYEQFIEKCRGNSSIKRVQTGRFGAHMTISLENDGPVTLLVDSKKDF